MQKLGMGLILGMTALLAGCSSSNNNSGSGSSNNGTGTSTQSSSTLTITTTSLAGGTVGAAYSSAVAASGGATPYTYSASGLPSGLSISSATGAITGTPAQSSIGTASATIKVTDSTQPTSQSATTSLSIKISPATLAVTTTSLPAGTAASPYPSTTLQASGGVPPYTWALASGSNLPAGLSLSASGAISGTPAAAGSYPLTFVVTDSFHHPRDCQGSAHAYDFRRHGNADPDHNHAGSRHPQYSLLGNVDRGWWSSALYVQPGERYVPARWIGAFLGRDDQRHAHRGGKHDLLSGCGGFNRTHTTFPDRQPESYRKLVGRAILRQHEHR